MVEYNESVSFDKAWSVRTRNS